MTTLPVFVIRVTFNHPSSSICWWLAAAAAPEAGEREDPKCPEEGEKHSRCNRDRNWHEHLLLDVTIARAGSMYKAPIVELVSWTSANRNPVHRRAEALLDSIHRLCS